MGRKTHFRHTGSKKISERCDNKFLYAAEIGAIPNGTEMTDYDILSDYYNNGDKLIIENTKYFGFNVRTYAE